MIEGNLEVKLPTIRTDGKAEVGRVREEKERRKKIREKEAVRRKKMQTREKDRKVAKNCVFLMFCGSGGSKSRLPKAAGAEPSGQLRNDKLHFIVARSSRFGSQKAQDTSRPHFGSSNVHKGYVVVVEVKMLKSARNDNYNYSDNCHYTTPQLQVQLQL